MARLQGRTGLIITIVVLGIVLLVVGFVSLTKKPTQPVSTNTDNSKNTSEAKTTPPETSSTEASSTATKTTSPTVDPESLTSIAIEPMNIAVFYSKGTPGFEFSVQKTANGTQYVEFTSPDLIGTKCTDDNGVFATIIKNPSSNEAQTVSQTIKVGDDTYGLSLASAGCTGDQALLTQYQTGFKNGFSSLKIL